MRTPTLADLKAQLDAARQASCAAAKHGDIFAFGAAPRFESFQEGHGDYFHAGASSLREL